ncbi:MAG: hypothetical protein Q4C96_09910 [Planctomycetia bacterium]|nr:hypothetical protein [Planctomycetia bacterium]
MSILPLGIFVSWGMFRHTEIYQQRMCRHLETYLGLPIKVERFQFLRPNKMRLIYPRIYQNTLLSESFSDTSSEHPALISDATAKNSHPESSEKNIITSPNILPRKTSEQNPAFSPTDHHSLSQKHAPSQKIDTLPMMSTPSVEVLQKTSYDGDHQVIRQMELTLPELTLDGNCLETLWQLHQRILTRYNILGKSELELTVSGPIYVRGEQTLELREGKMRLFPTKNGHQTEISFLLPAIFEKNNPSRIQLILQKSFQNSQQTMEAILSTDEHGLPTLLLQKLFPSLKKLGNYCQFYGTIILQQTFTGWNGTFQGRFTNIDLTACFSHSSLIQGQGTLEIQNAEFHANHLVHARGTFHSPGGIIHRNLLDRLLSVTKLTTHGIPLDMTPSIPYTEFSFQFTLENNTLQLSGNCAPAGAGIFLTGKNGPILREPPHSKQKIPAAVFFEAFK